MLIKVEPVPSDGALRTLWPDTRPDDSPRRRNTKPPKTEAEREAALRDKWGNPQHGLTRIQSGDGRRKDPPFNGDKRQTYQAPTPEDHGKGTIANPVSFYGPASKGIPGSWGSGLGAVDAREHGAHAREVKLRDPKFTRLPSGEIRIEPGKGEIRRNADGTAETISLGWKGGAERISTKFGDRIVYPASDKLPCHGSGARTVIVHTVEVQEGKRGPRNADVYRSKCTGCGIVRDVAKKIAEGAKDWEFPVHAPPKEVPISGFQNRGGIVTLDRPCFDGKGDRILATVTRDDLVNEDGSAETPAWMPAPACPEQYYGQSVNLAMGEAEYGDHGKVLGMRKHRELIREALVASVPIHLPIYLAHEGGRTVEKRGILASVAAPSATVAVDKGRPVANGRVKDVGVTDLEAARIKRAATPMILCDARRAPPRNILAF